jgi:hypothetical protein
MPKRENTFRQLSILSEKKREKLTPGAEIYLDNSDRIEHRPVDER